MTYQIIDQQKEKVLCKFNEIDNRNLNFKKLIKEIDTQINKVSEPINEEVSYEKLCIFTAYLKNMKVSLFNQCNALLLELEDYDKEISQYLEKRDIIFVEEDFADKDYDNHITKLLEKKEFADKDAPYFEIKKPEYGENTFFSFPQLLEKFQDNFESIDLIKSNLTKELKIIDNISDKQGMVTTDEELINALEEELTYIPNCECYLNDLIDKTVELSDILYRLKNYCNIMKVLYESIDD